MLKLKELVSWVARRLLLTLQKQQGQFSRFVCAEYYIILDCVAQAKRWTTSGQKKEPDDSRLNLAYQSDNDLALLADAVDRHGRADVDARTLAEGN